MLVTWEIKTFLKVRFFSVKRENSDNMLMNDHQEFKDDDDDDKDGDDDDDKDGDDDDE